MSELEPRLPHEYQFETQLKERREKIVRKLFARAKKLHDVIDYYEEFDRPYQELWEYSGKLAEVFAIQSEDTKQVQAAMYRGMSFGFQVADRVKQRYVPNDYPLAYLHDVFNCEDPASVIREHTEEYFETHENFDSLLYTFMPEIDASYTFSHHAKLSAGIVLMTCEEGQARVYERARERRDATQE